LPASWYGHGADAVGCARHLGKQLRQLGVDALDNIAVAGQQRLAAGMEVPRVAVQVLEPLRQAAGMAGLAPGGLDVALQPRHLAQPDVVQLPCGQRQCGVLGD
jgi:hypothetical protein